MMVKPIATELVSPMASVQRPQGKVCPHPDDLAGKTVVLYWNGKPNGDLFLNRIADLLEARIDAIEVIRAWEKVPATRYTKPTPSESRKTAALIETLKPDLVIGAPGDCAGCVTWLTTDLLNMEKLGIPTLAVVSSPFLELAMTTSRGEGFGEQCFVDFPPPLGMLAPEEVEAKAEGVLEDLLAAAIKRHPSIEATGQEAVLQAKRITVAGSLEEVNAHFLKNKWSLGLPVLPPTPDRVQKMLDGIQRDPAEVIGKVPPEMGTLTVELTAVYAAMAGCRPQYMPLLAAAIEALLDPRANARLALTGTGTSQLVFIFNGPVVKALGLGCGQGAAGKGYHPNGSLGYAVNLIAYAVGGSGPPVMDRSTLASPSDYVCWVFGENEDELPHGWEPLHVQRGYDPVDSVVTVMVSYPPVENNDHWSMTAGEHLRWWRHIVSPLLNMGGPAVGQVIELSPLVALGPEHARLLASSEWRRKDFLEAFWEQTRIPLSAWPMACDPQGLADIMGPLGDDSLIPITRVPENILTVIAGGDGKQSHFFAPFPGSFPVSRKVTVDVP